MFFKVPGFFLDPQPYSRHLEAKIVFVPCMLFVDFVFICGLFVS